MKIGLGLYREQLTPDNYRFALQAGATHIVAHLTNYFAGRIPANGQRAPAIAAELYAGPFSPKFPQDRGKNMAIRVISPWRDMERTDLSPIRQHEKDGPEHCAQRLYAQAAMGPGQCPSRRWRNAHPQAIPQPYRG